MFLIPIFDNNLWMIKVHQVKSMFLSIKPPPPKALTKATSWYDKQNKVLGTSYSLQKIALTTSPIHVRISFKVTSFVLADLF